MIHKFVIKVLIFLSFLLLILFVVFLLNKFCASFKIDKKCDILVVGHSHSECAFNDSLIDGVANLSQSGESYFYTFIKIKLLLEQNANIKTLFIEYSNNQIDKHMDDWIWGDYHLFHRFKMYGSFMDLESLKLLFVNNPRGLAKSIYPTIRKNFRMIINGFDYSKTVGGYLYLERNKTDSIVKTIPHSKVSISTTTQLSNKNIEYLQKIIKYCESRLIKVYLIRSPLHEKYAGFQNEKFLKSILSSKFSNIEFLDFSYFPLSNSEFGDLEHLNHKGAKIFSIWFARLLQIGILDKSNKQKIIDDEIKIQKDKRSGF